MTKNVAGRSVLVLDMVAIFYLAQTFYEEVVFQAQALCYYVDIIQFSRDFDFSGVHLARFIDQEDVAFFQYFVSCFLRNENGIFQFVRPEDIAGLAMPEYAFWIGEGSPERNGTSSVVEDGLNSGDFSGLFKNMLIG